MGSLVYSAAGTANAMGAAFRKLDVTTLDPGLLMRSSEPTPSSSQARAEAALPLAQQLRGDLLQTMGLTESELAKMRPETRADLETQIARHVHGQVLAQPAVRSGAYVDLKA
ncbi:MAG: hypothetical protein KKE02_17880 [Alphaproteobacteria bacterium]|nr:hypothetical protein [Alphaproteobacteria bacterium]MBU1515169.1 hypothetical protein [Alphaproteobacteria bacterium]MBU2092299.1 hypothetical protein [Alphaproteobacteria bacterium]MBU2152893.1 hypothetical protein [Alphaproteobacteria bacterium]MBU2305724.1 hypothetical protein [Alphaproteobacteria bacterium]